MLPSTTKKVKFKPVVVLGMASVLKSIVDIKLLFSIRPDIGFLRDCNSYSDYLVIAA